MVSPRSKRLPPLRALRAFEAAGRHLSFTRAAGELHVTQAAISHQVKELEDYLGVRLFRRHTRKLALTREGKLLLPPVREAFHGISEAIEALRLEGEGGTLTVMLRPYFSARWLSHRLGRFFERHPDVDLRLHHSIEPVDFSRGDVDMAIRFGKGDWKGMVTEPLMPLELTPVCSPRLLGDAHPLREPSDLRHYNLLHEQNSDMWARWLALAGAAGVDPAHGPVIDDTNVRIQAAIDGQGVTFGAVSLNADDLATGRLVRPFDLALTDYGYFVVYPRGALSRPKVKAFRDWLLEEAVGERDAAAFRPEAAPADDAGNG